MLFASLSESCMNLMAHQKIYSGGRHYASRQRYWETKGC